jgi:hypothetical protein
MKQTLLEIVQRVAEFCSAGSVNSIKDTRESMQIAKIVKETFEDLIIRREIVTGQSLIQLQSISDLEKPTHLLLPAGVIALDNTRYKTAKGTLSELQYVEPLDFVESSLNLDPTQENITTVKDYSGVLFNVYNDRDPSIYTVMTDGANECIVFNAYNKSQEDTLQGVNVVAYGHVLPEFKLEDNFIPPLSIQQFPVLVSRAKTFANKELKDQENALEYDKGRKQFIQVSQKAHSQFRGSTLWLNRKKNTRR